MSMIIMQLGYIGSLHGRWPLGSVWVGVEAGPDPSQKEQLAGNVRKTALFIQIHGLISGSWKGVFFSHSLFTVPTGLSQGCLPSHFHRFEWPPSLKPALLLPWRWRQQIPPKCWYSPTKLYGAAATRKTTSVL